MPAEPGVYSGVFLLALSSCFLHKWHRRDWMRLSSAESAGAEAEGGDIVWWWASALCTGQNAALQPAQSVRF